MVSLSEIQLLMGQTIQGKPADKALLEAIVADGLSARERLQVHRNTYTETLTSALASVFPVSEAFVGKVFLGEALRQFIASSPPQESMLFRYGEGFPRFLAGYEPAAGVAYVADVAKLEWLTHELMNGRDYPSFGDLEYTGGSQGRNLLHPNARLLVSTFPVFDLWRVGTGQLQPEELDADGEGQAVLVLLHEGQVFYQVLEQNIAFAVQQLINMGELPVDDVERVQELLEQGILLGVKNEVEE